MKAFLKNHLLSDHQNKGALMHLSRLIYHLDSFLITVLENSVPWVIIFQGTSYRWFQDFEYQEISFLKI